LCAPKTQNITDIFKNTTEIFTNSIDIPTNFNDILSFLGTAAESCVRSGWVGCAQWMSRVCSVNGFDAHIGRVDEAENKIPVSAAEMKNTPFCQIIHTNVCSSAKSL